MTTPIIASIDKVDTYGQKKWREIVANWCPRPDRNHKTSIESRPPSSSMSSHFDPPQKQHSSSSASSSPWKIKDRINAYKAKQSDKAFWKRVKHLIRTEGISQSLRPTVWMLLARTAQAKEQNPGLYGELKRTSLDPSIFRCIRIDARRTLPRQLARMEDGLLHLENVLVAAVNYMPSVGYTSGMAVLLCWLLIHIKDKEDTFWTWVRLCKDFSLEQRLVGNRCIFADRYVHEHLFPEYLPALARHMQYHLVHTEMYSTAWYLLLGLNWLCDELVERVWDLFLLEGFDIMYSVAMAYLKLHKDTLMEKSSFEEIAQALWHRNLGACDSIERQQLIPTTVKLHKTIVKQAPKYFQQYIALQQQQQQQQQQSSSNNNNNDNNNS